MTDEMLGRLIVLVVNEIERKGAQRRELRHLRFIQHTAVFILKMMTALYGADIGQEVQLAFLALDRGSIG